MSQPGRRGRPSGLTTDTRHAMFLRAVYDHPWAGPGLVEAYSGLYEKELVAARQSWVKQDALYAARYVTGRKSAARYALKMPGAIELGESGQEGSLLRQALFRIESLDVARQLLTEWAYQSGLAWSLSPFEINTVDTRLPPQDVEVTEFKPPAAFSRPRALKLDALGCARLGHLHFINFVVLVDPGDIVISWLYSQFRSFQRWGQREEFKRRKAAFPVFIFVAANSTRLEQALYLWRAAALWEHRAEQLFATTRWQVSTQNPKERAWWNESFGRVSLWSGVMGVAESSTRADRLPPKHWDHRPPFTEPATGKVYGPLDVQPPFGERPAGNSLLAIHQRLSPTARAVLRLIARYPLLTSGDLRLLLNCTKAFVSQCLSELKPLYQRLTSRGGLILSPQGLKLLAAQAGFAAREYANLRRWPIRAPAESHKRSAIELSTKNFKEHYAHARMALEFMIGLNQVARRLPLHLVTWDLEYIYVFRSRQGTVSVPGSERPHQTVIPDAVGSVSVSLPDGTSLVTEFWLEIDRGQLRGTRLRRKLAKYYQARGGYAGTLGWLPRLLLIVRDDDERRAQALARRIRQLDSLYGRRLDVLIARNDQMRRLDAMIDPARQIWRRPGNWAELVVAFDGLQVLQSQSSDPPNSNPGFVRRRNLVSQRTVR